MMFIKRKVDGPDVEKSNGTNLPGGAWLVVILLFFVGALNYIDRSIILTMRLSVIDAIPMTETKFGLLTSVFLWTYGLLSPLGGFLADRFKRSHVIIVSLFIWSVVTWVTAYCTTYNQLLVTRILLSISQACYIPAALALIVDYHRGPTRSFATGVHLTGIMIGLGMSFLGGWIAERQDWTNVFIIFGVIGVLYAIFIAFFLREAPIDDEVVKEKKPELKINFFEALKDLFSRKAFILALMSWGLVGVIGALLMGWLPAFYIEKFNLPQGISGLYATTYLYPVAIIGLLVGGYWADRWSRTNPLSRIYVPVIGLVIAAPCIYFASNTTILPLAIILFALTRLLSAFKDSNMMAIICLITDPRYRATGYGVLNFFSTILGGFGLYAGGVLRDSKVELSTMIQFAALIYLVCAVLLYMVKSQSKMEET